MKIWLWIRVRGKAVGWELNSGPVFCPRSTRASWDVSWLFLQIVQFYKTGVWPRIYHQSHWDLDFFFFWRYNSIKCNGLRTEYHTLYVSCLTSDNTFQYVQCLKAKPFCISSLYKQNINSPRLGIFLSRPFLPWPSFTSQSHRLHWRLGCGFSWFIE